MTKAGPVSYMEYRNQERSIWEIAKVGLVLFFLFYFFALLQVSFMPHIVFFGIIQNILVTVFLLFLLFEKNFSFSLFGAVFAGFFLDIFSQHPIGLSISILLFLRLGIKFLISFYVRLPLFFQR